MVENSYEPFHFFPIFDQIIAHVEDTEFLHVQNAIEASDGIVRNPQFFQSFTEHFLREKVERELLIHR